MRFSHSWKSYWVILPLFSSISVLFFACSNDGKENQEVMLTEHSKLAAEMITSTPWPRTTATVTSEPTTTPMPTISAIPTVSPIPTIKTSVFTIASVSATPTANPTVTVSPVPTAIATVATTPKPTVIPTASPSPIPIPVFTPRPYPTPTDIGTTGSRILINSSAKEERCLEVFKEINTYGYSLRNWKCLDFNQQWFEYKNSQIVSSSAKLCLDLDEKSIQSGEKRNRVILSPCNEQSIYQKFILEIPTGHIVNNAIKKCLEIKETNNNGPDELVVSPCKSYIDNQKFALLTQFDSYKQIVPSMSIQNNEKCIQFITDYYSTTNGALVNECDKYEINQLFAFQMDGTIKIKNTNKCFSKNNKQEFLFADCNAKDKMQQFTYDNTNFKLIDIDGLCLNIENDINTNIQIQFQTCTNKASQIMYINCNNKNGYNTCLPSN